MNTNASKSPRSFVAAAVHAVPRSGIRDFFDLVNARRDVISLSIGEPDFVTPWHIREAAIYALEQGATSYTSNAGMFKLRVALGAYVQRVFGVEYRAEDEILVTVGVSEALDLALRAVLNPGDEVLYHEPCYVSYAPAVRFSGGVPRPVETALEQGFQFTVAALEQRVTARTKALILNYPNNPTGAVLSAEQLQDIVFFACRHDLLVIADEIYAELNYRDPPASIAARPGMRERCIFLHGFSKAWAMTGLRIGYACGPAELIAAMMKIHQYAIMCVPTPLQEAALEALRDPEADIQEMRSQYRQRRNLVLAAFQGMQLPCLAPDGAFYAFPAIREFGLSSREFALRLLQEEQVAVVPGDAFGPCGEGHVRCSFATALETLKMALERMERFVERLRNAR